MSKVSFKTFLSEGAGSYSRRPLTPKEAADRIMNACRGWLQYVKKRKEIAIWRGDNNHTKSLLSMGDSNSFTREAANTNNWYALWIDNSKKWSDFPKRTKSYICTSDADAADGYGTLHVVIPTDTAHIGVVPASDMWFGFEKKMISFFDNREIDNVEKFQMVIQACADLVGQEIDSKDFTKMLNDLKRITVDKIDAAVEKVKLAVDVDEKGLFFKTFLNNKYLDAHRHVDSEQLNSITKAITDNWIGVKFNAIREFGYAYNEVMPLFSAMKRHGLNDLAEVFDVIFTPEQFTQYQGQDLASFVHLDKEIWIQGQCIFISCDRYRESGQEIDELHRLLEQQAGIDLKTLMSLN